MPIIVREVQSMLLPLSSVERVLERTIMMLGRKFLEVELVPDGDVEIIDPEKGQYDSTGNDPRFSMKIGSYPPREGWYYLEAALTRPNGDRTAKIYVDRGRGYSEPECIFIPSNLRGSIREVFYLPGDVQALRWDPAESCGVFSQSQLVIHRITAIEAFFRRAWRVLLDIWRFRDKPPQARAGLTLGGRFRTCAMLMPGVRIYAVVNVWWIMAAMSNGYAGTIRWATANVPGSLIASLPCQSTHSSRW